MSATEASSDNPSTRAAELVRELASSIALNSCGDDLVAKAAVAVEELVVADEELRAQAEELAASRDAVDEERERYAELFEMLPDAVIETDNHGKILEANDAAGRLLGVPMRMMRGKLLISFVRADDRKRLRRLLAERGPRRVEPMLRMVNRNGKETLVAASFSHRTRHDAVRVLWSLRDLGYLAEIHRLDATVEELGQLVGLQRLIGVSDPLGPLIDRILAGAPTVFPGFELVVTFDERMPGVASGNVAAALADAEAEAGEGPMHDTIATTRLVQVSGLGIGRRWPTVGTTALELGIHGVIGVPVLLDGEPVGAVVAWRSATHAFDGAVPLLTVLAENLAIAHANSSLYEHVVEHGVNMERALEHRGVIERAKGMLMYASGATADQAFAMLREVSQRSNRKLREVARDVAEGRLPLGKDGLAG